jgi:hypothetical protein
VSMDGYMTTIGLVRKRRATMSVRSLARSLLIVASEFPTLRYGEAFLFGKG